MSNESRPDYDRDILPPGKPTQPPSIFDLSFHGGLPTLLRAIADRIDAGETAAQTFEWSLSKDHLEFKVRLEFDEVSPR